MRTRGPTRDVAYVWRPTRMCIYASLCMCALQWRCGCIHACVKHVHLYPYAVLALLFVSSVVFMTVLLCADSPVLSRADVAFCLSA